MIFHRVGKCFGIQLWRGQHGQIELWVCFAGVATHRHSRQAFQITPLIGWADFYRQSPGQDIEHLPITPRCWLRTFTVPADWYHGFSTRFMVLLNESRQSMSAAENLSYL